MRLRCPLVPYLIVAGMVSLLVLLSGCTMTQQQKEALTSIGASSSGYAIGKQKPEIIDDFLKWNDKVLKFLDTETPTDARLKYWMQEGFNMVMDDEFLQFQFGNLLKVFNFDLKVDIQVPEVLTEEYKALVKEALIGFKMGFLQAKKSF